jgi:hypothetical protein
MCSLDIGENEAKTAPLVSITHLMFYRRVPLSREIQAYQRDRVRKLRQQGRRPY